MLNKNRIKFFEQVGTVSGNNRLNIGEVQPVTAAHYSELLHSLQVKNYGFIESLL